MGTCACSRRSARRGFTLLDLVITSLVIGILAAVTVPKFVNSLNRMRAEQAAQRIQVDLSYARQTAISESATQTVSFTPASQAYSITGLTDLDGSGATYSVALDSAPYNATLVSASLGGDSEIQFDRYGDPDTGGVITVESGGYQETVTVDPDTGKASIP